MMVNSSTPLSRSSVYRTQMLVVEDNADHWSLIQAASQQVMPQVEVIWSTNSERALSFLNNCLAAQQPLPKLLLLDLYLPDAEQSWQLLRTLKQRNSPFLQMPVVVISHSDRRDDINDFYALGGTSYIVKPASFEQWLAYFETVRQYWWETVTLPSSR